MKYAFVTACPGLFPGGNARASLKHSKTFKEMMDNDELFPGGNARASLKPDYWARDMQSVLISSSRAETPGPH